MTFYEAALEVLRRNERPLHFKKITEISIREQLLSHIGRDPSKVMFERLQKEIEKGEASYLLEPRRNVFDLKADIRKKLNEEANKKDAALVRASYGDIMSDKPRLRRRPSQSKDNDQLKANSLENKISFYEFDEYTLKKLAKSKFESISDAVYAILKTTRPTPIHVKQLSSLVFGKKLVKFHTHTPTESLVTGLITANQIAQNKGEVPPFVAYSNDRWGLTEWGFSDSSIGTRDKLNNLAQFINLDTQKQLTDSLASLKPEAFEILIMTLLNLLEYTNIKVSKRSSSTDVYFSADWAKGFSSTRVCILVIGNKNSEVNANTISELNETLSNYNCEEGVLIHLGKYSQDAINASKDNPQKITLLDSDSLSSLLLKHGIGVQTINQPLLILDRLFFDSLG